jgi:macrolide transport system ATP-binding/permease protein
MHSASGFFYPDRKAGGLGSAIFPWRAFELFRGTKRFLSVTFAYRPERKLNVVAGGQAEVTSGEYVSGDYFQGLGVVPAAGRLIGDGDDRAGAPAVAVFSYAFARARFGDAASAAGRQILINNVPFTLIGVAPSGFFGVDPSKAPDIYVPFHADLLIDPEHSSAAISPYLDDHHYWTEMMGRLRPGVTREQAEAALAPMFDRWVASTAATEQEKQHLPKLLIRNGADGLDNLRRDYSEPLYILLGMVGLILAIACANIANLLLARATARTREMAVRLSLGAGSGRIIRQLLTESLLLASIGGAAGILLGVWGIRLLTLALSSPNDAFPLHAELSMHALLFTLALTVVTGLFFGMAPALQATRVDPMPVLKESRTAGSRPHWRLRFSLSKALMVAQMAISLLLLAGAGLFVRTLLNLESLDPGFQRARVLLFRLNAHQAGHKKPEIFSFYTGLLKRFAAIPGVRIASMANAPLIGDGAWGWPIVPAGIQKPADASTGYGSGFPATETRVLATGPGFFSTMQIPLVAGREFNEKDIAGGAPMAVVNQAWAKIHLPGLNPVGQYVVSYGLEKQPQQLRIIGLAKNARYDNITGDFPAIVYLPASEKLDVNVDEVEFMLRTAVDPLSVSSAVRNIVHEADTRIPVTGLETQSAQIEGEMTQQTLFARLCAAFAALALAIACVGLYGMMSYTVARRTSEIGIRMALGAQRGLVIRMVLRDVLALAAVGIAISVPAALATTRFVASLLFGVKPADPQVLAAATGILLLAALLAGFVPARAASRIDPMIAVRQQ